MIRTSLSDPLRIDFITLASSGARIGMSMCPGKQTSETSWSLPWERDLETDIKAIADWGATALVSLITEHEFEWVNVVELPQIAQRHGLEWHHLPITDMRAPDERFETRWLYSGKRLRTLLTAGRHLALHCMGGLGRTGTIAARLMVELGDTPEHAISRVRSARRGTIQTPDQESHVYRCEAVAAPGAATSYGDRVLGCLLGGAVGDAFGALIEFENMETIYQRFGAQGLLDPCKLAAQLQVSDDTQMTMFTLEGLLRAQNADQGVALQSIRESYLDWLATQIPVPHRQLAGRIASDPLLRQRRCPGTTCLSGLAAGGDGSPEAPLNDSKGCGAAMRVAPVGLFPRWFDVRAAFELGVMSGALTHGHPDAYYPAGAMAAMVRQLIAGVDLREATHAVIDLLSEREQSAQTIAALRCALHEVEQMEPDCPTVIGRLGLGWSGHEALAIALYAALRGASFAQVIAIAANHSGDSDTTAALAGQLYGAWRGVSDLPHRWVSSLDVQDPLLGLTRQLIQTCPDVVIV
ncbi:MAG: ADP-ribosylglycohydrolase family protein [Burkholderiales bacterium]